MKTRYKITIITAILIVSFFVWPIPYNGICMLNNYDSCGTISAFEIPGVGLLRYDSLSTGNPNECWYQEDDGEMRPCMTGGAIDMDPDLSPSYAYDFAYGYDRLIISIAPFFVGISALFLVPYFILKRMNIPHKPYIGLISAGIMLFFGLPNIIVGLVALYIILVNYNNVNEQILIALTGPILIGSLLIVPSIVIMAKSSLIRKVLRKK